VCSSASHEARSRPSGRLCRSWTLLRGARPSVRPRSLDDAAVEADVAALQREADEGRRAHLRRVREVLLGGVLPRAPRAHQVPGPQHHLARAVGLRGGVRPQAWCPRGNRVHRLDGAIGAHHL
ncbi:MAG: hypothetical protein ACK559_39160, partial [bacterium]